MIRTLVAWLRRYDIIDVNISGKAAITFGLKVASQLLSFAMFVLLAVYLGASGFGIYVFVWGWIKILMIFGKNGMDLAATRYAGGYFEAGKARDLVLFQRFGGGVVAIASLAIALGGTGLVSIVPQLSSTVQSSFYTGFAMLPFWAGTAYLQALLRVRQHMIAGVLPDAVLRHVIQFVLIAAVLASGMALDAPLAMATALGGMAGAFVISLMLTWRTGIWADRADSDAGGDDGAMDWLKYGAVMIVISGSVIILRQIDVIMLGIMTTAGETGAYGAATRIANLATFAFTAVRLVVAPKIAGYYKTGNMQKLHLLLRHASALVAAASFVIVVVLCFAAPYILKLIGGDFGAAYTPMVILLLAQLFNALTGLAGYVMIVTGDQVRAAIILGVTIVADIVLNALFIPQFGIIGAAMATGFAIVLWNCIMLIYCRRKLQLDPSVFALFRKE